MAPGCLRGGQTLGRVCPLGPAAAQSLFGRASSPEAAEAAGTRSWATFSGKSPLLLAASSPVFGRDLLPAAEPASFCPLGPPGLPAARRAGPVKRSLLGRALLSWREAVLPGSPSEQASPGPRRGAGTRGRAKAWSGVFGRVLSVV